MNFSERLQCLLRMHAFIRRKGTGNPTVFASKLNVSRATLFRALDDLASFGADIAYDKEGQTYYYLKDFELNINS